MNLLTIHRKRFKEAMRDWVQLPSPETEAAAKKIAKQLNMSQSEILSIYDREKLKEDKS